MEGLYFLMEVLVDIKYPFSACLSCPCMCLFLPVFADAMVCLA